MAHNMHNTALKNTNFGTFAGHSGTPCCYGLFARHGGASDAPYDSLNVGMYVGDQPKTVATNRQQVQKAMRTSTLLSARQVHGLGVYCLTEPLNEDREVDGFDALVTDIPDVGLMIQQADCQAVLLFDPRREVIAAIHCGWRGSVLQIVPQVIEVMAHNYGTISTDLQAVISPSLGPCCAEFVNYKSELPPGFLQFMAGDNHFDFWQITRAQLTEAGLAQANIQTAGHCTCCSEDYFSYRRATRQGGEPTGRNCSVIALTKKSLTKK